MHVFNYPSYHFTQLKNLSSLKQEWLQCPAPGPASYLCPSPLVPQQADATPRFHSETTNPLPPLYELLPDVPVPDLSLAQLVPCGYSDVA